MPAVVDDKGSVVVNPTTGKMFSRSSGVGANLVEDIADRVANQLADVREQLTPESKKEAKQQSAAELQPTVDAIERQRSYIPPVNVEPTSTPIAGTAASIGVEKPIVSGEQRDDELYKLRSDEWEKQRAEEENREVRTANYWGEQFADQEDNDDLIDYMANSLDDDGIDTRDVGNTLVNDTYARYLIGQGIPEDDVWAITHRPQSIEEDREMYSTRNISPDLFDGSVEYLDDGSANYYKLTSDMMTGTQYKKYRDDLGMGGREYIDPSKTYSKAQEARDYGFKPFLPDEASYLTMNTQDILDAPYEAGRRLSSARQLFTRKFAPYEISYTDNSGQQRTINGNEFDENAPAFLSEFRYDQMFNPDRFTQTPDDDSAYTSLVNQYSIPDVNGNDTYHYGHLVDVWNMPDNTYQFSFSDGSTVRTTPEYYESVLDENSGQLNIGKPERVPIDLASSMLDAGAFDPSMHQAMVNETIVPNADGSESIHYGQLTGVQGEPDGTYTFTFQDGSTANVTEEYLDALYDEDTGTVRYPEYNRVWLDDVSSDIDLDRLGIDLSKSEPVTDVTYVPDLVLPDGSRISIDDVERLLMDRSPDDDEDIVLYAGDGTPYTFSDDDISYNFSGPIPTLNNRPLRLGGQEFITDDGIDISNVANNAIDWSLGSLPISLGRLLPWIYSASGATRSLSGVNPMSYDPATQTYTPTMGAYDEDGNLRYGEFVNGERNDERSNEIRWSNFLGSVAVPLTEMMVGPVGEEIIPLGKAAQRIPAKSATGRFAIDALTGAAGEGVEEILGNPFEEVTDQGLSGTYADPVLDENGEPIVDMYGHEIRRTDQPAWQRMNNFLEDYNNNLNAFLGGALVAGTMGLLPGLTEGTRAIRSDLISRQTGTPLYVKPDENAPEPKRRVLDSSYVDAVNNAMRREAR